MTALQWYPARYEAHGSTSGDGATRLLGRPRLDPLAVLMRETLQNAWDARRHEEISFRVELRRLDDDQREVLGSQVFAEGAEHVLCDPLKAGDTQPARPGLKQALERDELWVLEIGDRGTVGLGGPLRADLDPEEGEPTDFIDFVFNLGAPRNVKLGGGTYGFGKTISYITSHARSVIVATRTGAGNGTQHRFIASAIGQHWAREGLRFTGRHWWGRMSDERIGPAIDSDATRLIRELGFQPFPVDGTSLMIVDPDLEELEPEAAIEHLGEAFVWHLWPKLVARPDRSRPSVDAEFVLQGATVPQPDPREVPGLAPFVEALDAVRRHDLGREPTDRLLVPPQLRTIDYGSMHRPLGTLGLVKMSAPWSATDVEPEVTARPFQGPSHHVALMRQAELVVEYVPGPDSPIPGYEWAGVFRSLPEADDDFAAAEPPAHDSWEWQSVGDARIKSHVRTAERKIKQEMRSFANPVSVPPTHAAVASVAGLADRLRSLVPSLSATATSARRVASEGGARDPSGVKIDLTGARPFYDGEHVVQVQAEIAARSGGLVALTVDAGVQTDTGTESEPPSGAAAPRVRSVSVDGRPLVPDPSGHWLLQLPDGGCVAAIEVASADPVALRISAKAERATPRGDAR